MSNDPIIAGWCISGISFCLGIIIGIIGGYGMKVQVDKEQAKKKELTPDEMKEVTKTALRNFNNSRK